MFHVIAGRCVRGGSCAFWTPFMFLLKTQNAPEIWSGRTLEEAFLFIAKL